MSYRVLAINPGSTSTKIALFDGEQEIFKKNVTHDAAELAAFDQVSDQMTCRMQTILDACAESGVDLSQCDAFCGRGGTSPPLLPDSPPEVP